MERPELQDTIACRVIDEFLSHIYNPDFSMEDEDYLFILKNFWNIKGSWEKLLSGDMEEIRKLEGVVGQFVNDRVILQSIG